MEIKPHAHKEQVKFHGLMGSVVVLLVAADLLLARVVHYTRASATISSLPLTLAFVASGALPIIVICKEYYPKWFSKSLDVASTALWTLAIWILIGPLVQIAARSPFPLVDATLARVDSQVLQTVTVVRWLQEFPALQTAMKIVYRLLWPFALTALFLPTLCGHARDVRDYLLAGSISLLVTLSLFALWPAAGPWTVEPLTPGTLQASVGVYLSALKSQVAPAGPELEEIVAFPSFHTVLAILSAAALWHIRKLRIASVVICVAICVSTVATGWHYVADVIAGAAVAAISQALAWRMLRMPAVEPQRAHMEISPGPRTIATASVKVL